MDRRRSRSRSPPHRQRRRSRSFDRGDHSRRGRSRSLDRRDHRDNHRDNHPSGRRGGGYDDRDRRRGGDDGGSRGGGGGGGERSRFRDREDDERRRERGEAGGGGSSRDSSSRAAAVAAAAAAMAVRPGVAPAASAASAAPAMEESYEEELASRAQNKEKKAQDFSSIMTAAMAEKKGGPGQREEQGEKFGEAKGDQFGIVWGKPEEENPETTEVVEVEKANFGLSGALATDEKTGQVLNGVTLKFQEPADSAVPDRKGPRWRFYVFRGDEMLETMHLYRQSVYLIGRDKAVADIYMRHESLSKQHAVLQYRERTFADEKKPFDPPRREVLPYLMDLGSTNGTFLNGDRIDSERYYELREKDSVKFGQSSREFVLLTDQSGNE